MQFHAAVERSLYTISGAVNAHAPNKKITPRIKRSLKRGKKKRWKIIKLSPQKVAVVTYYRWSVMRHANYRAFTGKRVVS